MTFQFEYNKEQIFLTLQNEKKGLLARLIGTKDRDLGTARREDHDLGLALADLLCAAADIDREVQITFNTISIPHEVAASLVGDVSAKLGLPPITDLLLQTDTEGLVGSSDFALRTIWSRKGMRVLPKRVGCILETDKGPQRVPLWMLEALELAETYRATGADASDWEVLARFRHALEPGVKSDGNTPNGRLSMTDFLSGLKISLADRFSIAPNATGSDFEIVPFSGENINESEFTPETKAELQGAELRDFQRKVRQRGALNSFRIGPAHYIVIDPACKPVLHTMAEMQNAPLDQRKEFIRNPRPRLTAAIEANLEAQGLLAELSLAQREEVIENAALPILVETAEYTKFSARVSGIEEFVPPNISARIVSGTTWLPEIFSDTVRQFIERLPDQKRAELLQALHEAINAQKTSILFDNQTIPASQSVIDHIENMRQEPTDNPIKLGQDDQATDDQTEKSGPIIVATKDNFDALNWDPKWVPRSVNISTRLPQRIITKLKDHQINSFDWQIEAWRSGLPGVLNADEQGLGKTLQTISFLVWLNEQMATTQETRKPILVVAPTSLLENWEQEVKRHVGMPGLGYLVRLYGTGISHRKQTGVRGYDIQSGNPLLDFTDLERMQEAGKGHFSWVLTTYSSLTNYQHSLAKIPFAAVVFDEIQALKNPTSLRAVAARAINADFRIALTGTPIENATSDLWAVMDQVAPGALGTLRDFQGAYSTPNENNMQSLYNRVFEGHQNRPALALRRMKDDVARDLPSKERSIVPRAMPFIQASDYDAIRNQIHDGKKGSALNLLHHIRSVSVHPSFDNHTPHEDFIQSSARMSATFEILRGIRQKNERALVFVEHRKMQYRLREIAMAEFGLDRIDLINGDTPIKERQKIVDRFQRNLTDDQGFDFLILGPRAAGTGLTLTAATHVIHLSRWWNPAVEEQCNDRVHRIGQTKPVHVYVPMAIHPNYAEQSFDCLLHRLMQRKRRLANKALWPMGDLTADVEQLQSALSSVNSASEHDERNCIQRAMQEIFSWENKPCPPTDHLGGYAFK